MLKKVNQAVPSEAPAMSPMYSPTKPPRANAK